MESLAERSRRKDIIMRIYRELALPVVLGVAASAFPYSGAFSLQDTAHQRNEGKMQQNLMREVRHQLLLLPYYSVFDNLMFKVDGDKVTLLGQVVRPSLK